MLFIKSSFQFAVCCEFFFIRLVLPSFCPPDLTSVLLPQVDAGDRLGRTPLGLAVWAGHTSIINALLQENITLSEEGQIFVLSIMT